jgi:hypothetical protein
MPRYLRAPLASELSTEPETEEEMAFNEDLPKSDSQTSEGTEQSNTPTATPESEASPASTTGGVGSGEEPPENRASSAGQPTNETVAAAGQAVREASTPTQLAAPATAPSTAALQAEAAVSPEPSPAVAPAEVGEQPETSAAPPVPGLPVADAELNRETADLNRTAEETEIPIGAAPEPAIAAASLMAGAATVQTFAVSVSKSRSSLPVAASVTEPMHAFGPSDPI